MHATVMQLLLAQAEQAPDQPSFLMQTAPILLMFVAVYFFLLRPMWKQNKDQQEMLKKLTKDDEVVTSGGIYGKIKEIEDKVVVLEVANGVKLKVLRSAIAGKWNTDAKPAAQSATAANGKG